MIIALVTAIPAGTDGDAAYTSAAIDTQCWVTFSVQGTTTSTAAGTIKVQVSNDPMPYSGATLVWTDLASASVAVSAGSNGIIPKTDCSYRWIRLVYTKSGSTGTVRAQVAGMSVG